MGRETTPEMARIRVLRSGGSLRPRAPPREWVQAPEPDPQEAADRAVSDLVERLWDRLEALPEDAPWAEVEGVELRLAALFLTQRDAMVRRGEDVDDGLVRIWIGLESEREVRRLRAEEQAAREALERVTRWRDRIAARGRLTRKDNDAYVSALLGVYRDHRDALRRRGIDVDAQLERLREQIQACREADAAADRADAEVRRFRGGPFGDVPYHG